MESCRTYIPRRAIGALSALTLCGILVAGLWPFHSPKNQVYWLGKENGLRFGKHGTILSSGLFELASADGPSCSLEIWLKPALTWNSGTLLAFYNPLNRRQFSLQQSATDLALQRDSGDQYHPTNLYVDEVLRGEQVLVTVTSDRQGTSVYIDGKLVKRSLRFGLSLNDLAGQLIVANSPLQSQSWPGQLRGLAIYKGDLSAEQVAQHYRDWTQKGKPAVVEDGRTVGLYLLDEHAGTIIHNQVKLGIDLYIPDRYLVVDQTLLEPPWKELVSERSYLKNALINICGFVPLGFVLTAYLSSVRQVKNGAFATIVLGALVSLIIEVLQAYLPTRDSGVTDVITNTLGTGIGVALYRAAALPLARVLAAGRRAGASEHFRSQGNR